MRKFFEKLKKRAYFCLLVVYNSKRTEINQKPKGSEKQQKNTAVYRC